MSYSNVTFSVVVVNLTGDTIEQVTVTHTYDNSNSGSASADSMAPNETKVFQMTTGSAHYDYWAVSFNRGGTHYYRNNRQLNTGPSDLDSSNQPYGPVSIGLSSDYFNVAAPISGGDQWPYDN